MNVLNSQFHDMVLAYLANNDVNTKEEVDNTISQLRQLPMFSLLTEDDIVDITKKITSERSIRLDLGSYIEGDVKYEKWFLSKKADLELRYWERYKKYLIHEKRFSINVVNTMDDINDTLTDLLGNPISVGRFQRRGLIVGDVQSGKTSNYIGLICKAADAGYKVIVLLTGTIEKLRRQTQLRLDEGFVGMDSAAMIKQKENNIVGVGKFDNSFNPMVLTSTTDDFKTKNARNLGFNLQNVKEPVLFVVKKNVSNLKNLNKWLKTFNKNGLELIDNSLLLVDDESDNASVNTNNDENPPTAINKQIRDLLNVFTRASYVGFTATPFANIFIDPDTNDEMLKEDLFPKDFIYSLNAPSNYIGPKDIFGDYSPHNYMLNEIDEVRIQRCIPKKHKGDYFVSSIPDDLKEAINAFLIANVIRDLRGDEIDHRSMLINVSTFNNVQAQVHNFVNTHLKAMQGSARLFSKLKVNEALVDCNIKSLYETYMKHYNNIEFKWDNILLNLHKAIAPIVALIVNQKSNAELNYEEYEKAGLRVIAIGGLSLSRGLTLEGLMVSYFYRNSKMYDILMQMGRWFGYRPNYADLCKIWMSEESISWYENISDATEELKNEIKRYQHTGLTPKDFGLRVRSDINTLMVTASNKMRTATTIEFSVTLSKIIIETTQLYTDYDLNKINYNSVMNLINSIKNNNYNVKAYRNNIGYSDIPKKYILELLSSIEISPLNWKFNIEGIKNFISEYNEKELENWDISFISGGSNKEFNIDGIHSINFSERSYSLENNNKIFKMSGSKNRLGSPNDGRYGLSDKQIEEVKGIFKLENPDHDEKKINISQKYYFKIKRRPCLMIYMVDLKDCKPQNEASEALSALYEDTSTPIIGFSLGIPELSNVHTKFAKYKINKIEQQNILDYENDENGDEE